MSNIIDLGPKYMNLQPVLQYLPKIKLSKKVKSIKPKKSRSSCVYNEGTNRCKYGSPHDAGKCRLNENGHCERHLLKANISIKKTHKYNTMTTPKTDIKIEPQVLVPLMNKIERVKRLREHLTLSNVKHEDQIMKLGTLKEAHTYCVIHSVSAQQFGPFT
jgi:hypothetical protein